MTGRLAFGVTTIPGLSSSLVNAYRIGWLAAVTVHAAGLPSFVLNIARVNVDSSWLVLE